MTLCIVTALSVALMLTLHACAHWWLSRPLPRAGRQPAISILKPLCGIDDGLLENLSSFARQRYARFQIVLGTEDPNDPALGVARRFQRRHPDVDVTIVAGAAPLGLNPKVTNLASLSRHAKYDVWLISDSNVRAHESYLAEIAAELQQPGVGMVCNVFHGVGDRSSGALLENLHLASWMPGGMCGAQVLTGQACVTGKSMLMRRADLALAGGWRGVKDVLAEDYVLGRRFIELGLSVMTSRRSIASVNADWSFRRFLNRHLRWATLRRHLAFPAYLAEPLINPVPWSVAAALAGAPAVGALGITAKIVSDALLARRVSGRCPSAWKLACIPPKDLLFAGIWLLGMFRRKVWWRGHVLAIGKGSRLYGASLPSAATSPVVAETETVSMPS